MQLKTNSELGTVSIENSVIAEIAGAVASGCYGVVGMAARNVADELVKLVKTDVSRGINVVVKDGAIVVDVHIIVRYGVNINTICRSIVNRVRYALENGIGLKVSCVNVRVEGVKQD
jgi:uncharacterized alkaline shock family protein YloU